jgi:Domain of unknown function (DUF4395)
MTNTFEFGEVHPNYSVRVLNEREVRGAAGIMFFVALVAFMNAWFKGDFAPTKLVIIAFFIDFFIRVVINPRYSPSLVLARFFVNNQTAEYVGAPQKRFAWAIGLTLASLMMYLVVLNNVKGPINMLTCLTCLFLLFFESAFGICIGCKLYNLFNKEKAQLCPGNVCEINEREPIQMIQTSQIVVLVFFVAFITIASQFLPTKAVALQLRDSEQTNAASEEERCKVPEFAKKMGHEEQWKLHNGC